MSFRTPLSTVILLTGLFFPPTGQCQSIADLDGNDVVDGRDIFAFVAQWLAFEPAPATGTQVGWVAPLVGQSDTYGVSGNATVVCATQIRIDDFSYLNNGPDVFLYLISANGDGDFTPSEGAAGLSIFVFSNDASEPFTGETLQVDLPEGVTIQSYTHISVWCRQFGADFGSGKFAPLKTLE